MGYKITKESYHDKTYIWDAECEVLLSLFVKRLCEIRPQLNYNTICIDILKKYIAKRKNSIITPTKIMREVR